jgi:hypothetical protein
MKLERDWYKDKLTKELNNQRPELEINAGVCTAKGLYIETGVGLKL